MKSHAPDSFANIPDLCAAFCKGVSAVPTPCGLAITVPFSYFGENTLTVYAIKNTDGTMRLEDSGETISTLESTGLDLTKGSRKEIIRNFCLESNVLFDEDNFLFKSVNFLPNQLSENIILFSEFMIGIQRVSFLTRRNVEDIFREEVINAVISHFHGEAEVVVDAKKISEIFPDTRADIVVQSKRLPPLAVFLGTSETKALEALFLWSELKGEPKNQGNVMLVLNQMRPHAVTTKTLQRASQRFPVSYFNDNAPAAVLDPMNKLVFAQ
ncbi:DUF1828 domain-containing protein [Gluconobacter thailandicus]|uniref:DUF1828 domain-containing protein n=1 Tax=Gluconobacter thailandicus TaxID=257438 RepID=A0AAP9ETU3_GLUTH|nr:DUF1828 domain-containing protein [Gluconobacter thailandicus]QEH97318.1 DUF1828 domain-containing protein [Gluconobacter thailandicus]